LEEWAWIVYPWNFIEDMTDIITGTMEREEAEYWDIPALKHILYKHHSVESISFEIAQPGRLVEVLREMERRGIVTSETIRGKTFWKKV
jgi:hypothetical protein